MRPIAVYCYLPVIWGIFFGLSIFYIFYIPYISKTCYLYNKKNTLFQNNIIKVSLYFIFKKHFNADLT